jgi:nucleotide-binding universal stress UspA family protein
MDVDWIVQLGLPSDEISFLAKEKQVDLVVMGIKDGGELDKLVGSTTSVVIRKCHQPVLVIHDQTVFAPFRSLAYATDFTYNTDASRFEPLKFLAGKFNAELVVVNIRKQARAVGGDQEGAKERLDQAFNNIRHTYQTVEDDDVDHGLIRFLHEQKPDLLTMVAHKHTLVERLFGAHHTRAMIYQTRTPLLILHDTD